MTYLLVQTNLWIILYLCTEYSQRSTKGDFLDCGLIIDGLGRLRLVQLCFQVTESAMPAQDLDGLLLYGISADAQILQTGKSGVLHVGGVKLREDRRYSLVQGQKIPSTIKGQSSEIYVYESKMFLPCPLYRGWSRAQTDSRRKTVQPD